jgi:hypothetical protein
LWNFGNDSHPFAVCLPGQTVERHSSVQEGSPSTYWTVKQKYSTRGIPPTQKSGDPLSRDPEVSGSFERYRKEVEFDRHGARLISTSFEPLQGEAREREFFHPVVNVTVVESTLNLSIYSQAMNSLNDSTLWGLPARHIQLSSFSWSEEKYGASKYYKISMGFRADFEGFDKEAVNGGQMALPPGTTPSDAVAIVGPLGLPLYQNPKAYVKIRDDHQNVGIYQNLSLLGLVEEDPSLVVKKTVEHYDEFNFLLLGVPAIL